MPIFDKTDFSSLPQIAIVTGTSLPFIQKAISRLRDNDRFAVLAGMDSEQFGYDVSCATPSRRAETLQLINYLCNCGKRRIAMVGFGMRSINDSFRYHAAMSAVASWGEVFQERDVWRWEQDPMDSFRSFARVAREYEAVVCPNDAIAIYLVNYLKQQGITVPDDLFVASFGNMAIGRYHRPSITSMTMDMQYVGKQAFSVWRHLMKSEQSMQRIALRNYRAQQDPHSGKHRSHAFTIRCLRRFPVTPGQFLSPARHFPAGPPGKMHQSEG